MAPPDLSIIIPTFRREEPLREAVLSVLALQGLDFEVIVIDDSPEGSAAAVIQAIGDPRVQYSKHPAPTGGRPAIIRNGAARQARGKVFFFLDDDDKAIPHNLAKAFQRLVSSPAGVLMSTPHPFGPNPARVQDEVRYFAKALAFLDRPRHRLTVVARLLFAATPLVCSTCLIKASAFAAAGGFDETIPLCEDVEFYMRAIRTQGYLYQPEPILERRVGEASLISAASTARIAESYRMAHDKYRAQHGALEFWALKLWSRLLNRTTARPA